MGTESDWSSYARRLLAKAAAASGNESPVQCIEAQLFLEEARRSAPLEVALVTELVNLYVVTKQPQKASRPLQILVMGHKHENLISKLVFERQMIVQYDITVLPGLLQPIIRHMDDTLVLPLGLYLGYLCLHELKSHLPDTVLDVMSVALNLLFNESIPQPKINATIRRFAHV